MGDTPSVRIELSREEAVELLTVLRSRSGSDVVVLAGQRLASKITPQVQQQRADQGWDRTHPSVPVTMYIDDQGVTACTCVPVTHRETHERTCPLYAQYTRVDIEPRRR